MPDRWLLCQRCGREFALGAYFNGCPECRDGSTSASLEVHYDRHVAKRLLGPHIVNGDRADIWRFSPLLPVRDPERAIALGEGGTPLLAIPRLNDAIGVRDLYLKNECQNPTWSYKDRFNAVTVSVARELGYSKIASSSTGNHGASAAAYAAAAGMHCVVLVPDETPELLCNLIQVYGAQVVVTRWSTRAPLFASLVSDGGWFPASTLAPMPTGAPYGVEGYKTIAFELILATRERPLDLVFVPVGGGDGLYGLYKGWREFLQLGFAETMPKLVAVQPAGANPVVRAVEARRPTVTPVADAWSIATSTREEIAANHVLEAIYGTQGLAIDVTEIEIREALLLLAQHGIAVEAASALPIAGLRKAMRDGLVSSDVRVAALLTSSLTKWPPLLADLTTRPRNVSSLDELHEVLISANCMGRPRDEKGKK